jgi:hypothetical protein
LDLPDPERKIVAGNCKNGNELPGSIKGEKYLDLATQEVLCSMVLKI